LEAREARVYDLGGLGSWVGVGALEVIDVSD
jgi:hypothetical protein